MKQLMAALSLVVAGCAQQIRYGSNEAIDTIPQILSDQAFSNAVRAKENRYPLIAQAILKESLTTATNGINAGVQPGIAFRAIAFTGLSLASTNQITQNWSLSPVTDPITFRRLQLLYSYAATRRYTCGDRYVSYQCPSGVKKTPIKTEFSDFEKEFTAIGRVPPQSALHQVKSHSAADSGSVPSYKLNLPLSSLLGSLPDGPFIDINPSDNCRGGKASFANYKLDIVCFRGAFVRSQGYLEPQEVRSAFVIWALSIPALVPTDPKSTPALLAYPQPNTN